MARRRRREDIDNPYWISFSDLMSALLVVFLLAVVVLALQVTQKQMELTHEKKAAEQQQVEFASQVRTLSGAEDDRASMVQSIAADLQAQGIEVSVNDDSSVLSIPTELLGFEAASYEIDAEYHDVALAIGVSIGEHLREDDAFVNIDTVFIEGHTDNRAYNGLAGTGNWGLSTFRAISLWRLWESDLPGSDRLDTLSRPDGTPLFSVSGYGQTRPATDSQRTDAERAANRRIDIRFTEVGLTAEDLEEILDTSAKDS